MAEEQEVVPFFSKIRHRFKPVPENKRIEVKPFLDASREVLDLLDLFGVFLKPVKSDINGNITTLQEKFDANPEKYITFNDMLEEEKEAGTSTAYTALLWLKRALDFLASFVRLLMEEYRSKVESDSLTPISHQAYALSLEPYHNFIVRNFSWVLLRLIPSRSRLYQLLCGNTQLPESAATDIETCSQLLDANLHVVNQLFPEEEQNGVLPRSMSM